MLEVVDVRSTDAHRSDPDQDLVRAGNHVRPLFDRQISCCAQDADPHGTSLDGAEGEAADELVLGGEAGDEHWQ